MDNLDKAIKLFERIANMKVNSIRLEHSSPCHESYVINFEYLLHLAPEKDQIAYLGLHSEIEFFQNCVAKGYRPPLPPFYFCNADYEKLERYDRGDMPYQNVDQWQIENDSILEALSRLHHAPAIKTSFYPLRRYNLYKKYSAEKLPAGFEKKILVSAERILEQEGKVPCLNRLKKENIALTADGPEFLDARFLGANRPIADLASLCEENDFDTSMMRKSLQKFNQIENEAVSMEELETLVIFFDGLWFYYYMSRYGESNEPHYLEQAKRRKERFLFHFNASLMEAES